MAVKDASNKRCCCADCSPNLPEAFRKCCLCTCDELCLRITDTKADQQNPCYDGCLGSGQGNSCSCVEGRGQMLWDPVDCRWEGTIQCGSLSISVIMELFYGVDEGDKFLLIDATGNRTYIDGDLDDFLLISPGTGTSEGCWIKLTIDCLGINGELYSLNDCGTYVHDCTTRTGGPLLTFDDIDASQCGDLDCDSIDLQIYCEDFINPAPNATDKDRGSGDLGCRDCDCVCECLCISYDEAGCIVEKKACWDGSKWEVTFDDGCPWDAQTVTITVVEGDDNCCKIRLDTSRGTVDTPEQTLSCPRPSNTWTGSYNSGTASNSFTVEIDCSDCDECYFDTECCTDPLPLTIHATVCESNCGITTCFPMAMNASTAEEVSWRGQGIAQCSEELDTGTGQGFNCYEMDVDIELACVYDELTTTWQFFFRLYDGETLLTDDEIIGGCEPFCVTTGDIPVETFVLTGPATACVGTSVIIDFMEKCRPEAE